MLLPKGLLAQAMGSSLALQVMTNDQNMLEDNRESVSYPLRLSKWIVRLNSLPSLNYVNATGILLHAMAPK